MQKKPQDLRKQSKMKYTINHAIEKVLRKNPIDQKYCVAPCVHFFIKPFS